MSLSFRWALRSDVGLVRSNNEDCAYARPDLLVLADGMGGHAGGEVASVVALHAYAAARFDDPASHPRPVLAEAAATTRAALQAMSSADESLATMGTTAVAVAHTPDGAWVSHIGDSRIYLLRAHVMTQLTTDHTHVQHLVEIGSITPEQVPSHPYRAMLLRSLDDQGVGAAPDIFGVDLLAGDRLLLCSDGLSDYVAGPDISRALATEDLDGAAAALVEAALRGGTRDNVTVIVADVTDSGAESAAEYTGAASAPMRVSAQAQEALRGAFPGFAHAITDEAGVTEPLTETTLLPVLPQVPPQGAAAPDPGEDPPAAAPRAPERSQAPVPAILVGLVVVAVSAAIGFLLS